MTRPLTTQTSGVQFKNSSREAAAEAAAAGAGAAGSCEDEKAVKEGAERMQNTKPDAAWSVRATLRLELKAQMDVQVEEEAQVEIKVQVRIQAEMQWR